MNPIQLPDEARLPMSHKLIERGGRIYNVIAETPDSYATADALAYVDGFKVHIQWWSKEDCRVVEVTRPPGSASATAREESGY